MRSTPALLDLESIASAYRIPADSVATLREALAVRIRTLGDGHWMTANTRSVLGECLLAQGRIDEARPLLEQAQLEAGGTSGDTRLRAMKDHRELAAVGGGGAVGGVVVVDVDDAEVQDLLDRVAHAVLHRRRHLDLQDHVAERPAVMPSAAPRGHPRLEAREGDRRGEPGMFYVHPWEIDPDQPRVEVPWLTRRRHYGGLDRMLPRIQRLLQDFAFTSVAAYYGFDPRTAEEPRWPMAGNA